MKEITVTNTDGLMELAKLAHGSPEDNLRESLDPDGFHMLGLTMLHNDVEWRTQWYIKLRGESSMHMIWLDVPLDALDKYTHKVEVEEEN
jgi:hypothetical protein